ncbi:EAL domain-containing protein [Sulfitobacter albidus]|uniref:EAL domain-containing protein n=1 Tax=Sulfitobacter albidus TaxID=2829501 RepID=A0A975JBT4_9RHOB|nr:EAL domain-containing protein [Sulfitobacter albidus]QUJ75556.1 EAL domain-containing protein [Sulfitobacter albidus]
MNKRLRADMPPGADNPLNYAVALRDQSTLDMVADAIEHRQTLLAYQPVMRTDQPDKVGFYEGLIRVLDPGGRVIPAAEFMPQIETTEIGRQIDVLALRHGLSALRDNPLLRLSINMSARSVGYRPWMNTLNRFLTADPGIGHRLILEVTESSAMTMPELVTDFMERMQQRGICFALDDFGAGYTAIRYFKDFYFDMLKIDGSFIRGIANDPDNQALTRAMVSIAHHFDMLTVAECIENPDDAACVAEIGVDCLQGYYFAAPTTRPDWMRETQMRAAG